MLVETKQVQSLDEISV